MIYIMSDLHGCYHQLQTMLKTINLQACDTVFVLGDIVDRGSHPILLLKDFMARSNVFPILGNHEFSFLQTVSGLPIDVHIDDFMCYLDEVQMVSLAYWMNDGGRPTLEQYLALPAAEKEAVIDYLEDMPLYEELNLPSGRYLLTHSGLAHFNRCKGLEEYEAADFLFDRPEEDGEYFTDRTLICGHTPTFLYHKNKKAELIVSKSLILVDCGCVFSSEGGRLGCLRLEDNKRFYT